MSSVGLTPIHSALVFLIYAIEASREYTRAQEREIDRRMLDGALKAAKAVLEDDTKARAKAAADRAAV